MRIKKGQENGAKKIGINNEMNANDMRLPIPTKGYRIFLYCFSVDYRIWQNKYMRWMKIVIDGKEGAVGDNKTYHDNDSSDYHMIGADIF